MRRCFLEGWDQVGSTPGPSHLSDFFLANLSRNGTRVNSIIFPSFNFADAHLHDMSLDLINHVNNPYTTFTTGSLADPVVLVQVLVQQRGPSSVGVN